MQIKRIIFTRSGETEWNRLGRWQGWVASPLNAHGRHQVGKLANFLRNIGIGVIYFGRGLPWAVGGLVLIVLPHVVGAPQPDGMASDVPAELAAHFASTSLVIHALIWIVPAAIAGYAMSRMTLADQTV